MRLGFTGTQIGMNPFQKFILTEIIKSFSPVDEFHHGDCIGADADAHAIALLYVTSIVIHPPIDSSKRAFCHGHKFYPEKQYLDRNYDIVIMSDIMIGTPRSNTEYLRSGTWSTIRKSKKLQKHLFIIYPGFVSYTKGDNEAYDEKLRRAFAAMQRIGIRVDSDQKEV